jgi:hypothetical protein
VYIIVDRESLSYNNTGRRRNDVNAHGQVRRRVQGLGYRHGRLVAGAASPWASLPFSADLNINVLKNSYNRMYL